MELVAGKAQHINVLFLHIDLDVTHSLNGVGVEGNAGFLADRADLSNGQHGTDFIVGVHDGDQTGILPNGITNLLCSNVVTLGHIQIGHIIAFFF